MCSSSETLTDLKFLCNLAPRENKCYKVLIPHTALLSSAINLRGGAKYSVN